MMRALAILVRDRRAGVGVLVAAMLPVLIGMAAFAVDLGAAQLDTRRLQGIADTAALAAAANPAQAQAAAIDAVAAAGFPRPIAVTATPGIYDATSPLRQRFVPATQGTQAARVMLSAQSPTFFARIFGIESVEIRRGATATQTNLAAFSIGSGLASVQGGIANSLLSALTGSTVSLSVMDYNALAGAQIDLLDYLDALRTTASLDAGTYDDTLDAKVTTPQLLNALADSLPSADAAQAGALRGIAARVGPTNVALSSLVDLGPLGNQSAGGRGIAKVDALAMLSTIAQIGNGDHQVQLDLGASVAGLAQTRVWLAIGQRPQNSPWMTVTASGTPIIRTAQMRLYVQVSLVNLSLPGIGALAALKVPLYVELASAEAKLDAIDCSGSSRSVTIDARPSPGQAAIATIDPAKLADFSKPVPLSTATVLDTLLIDVDAKANLNLGAAQSWQPVRFTQNDIDRGTGKTVSSDSLAGGIAASLIENIQLTVRLIGLPLNLSPLLQAVGHQLAIVAPLLDGLVDTVTGLLGVHLGQANVHATGLRCGTAALVA